MDNKRDKVELSPEERERIFQEELAKRSSSSPKPATSPKSSSKSGWVGLIVLLVIGAIGLSFVHIVWNVPGGVMVFAKREPGLGDTFVNYDSLTGIPKIILLAQHSSVVKGLEERGLIKWESPFDKKSSTDEGGTPPFSPSDFGPKKADLELVDYKSESGEYSGYVVGHIKNKSPETCRYASIHINLLDKHGNRVGSTMDNITNLGPGETWRFKALITSDDCVKFQIGEIEGHLTR